jgi:hypothetical protein
VLHLHVLFQGYFFTKNFSTVRAFKAVFRHY